MYKQIRKLFLKIYKPISICWQNVFRTRFATDMYISQMNVVTLTHQKTFSEYKNIYNNKNVAIIATGPSLNLYKPISNVINIGLNSAIAQNAIPLDYLFVQDYEGLKKCIDEIEKKPSIKKFYGCIPEHPFGMKEICFRTAIIPESIRIRHNAEKYFLYSQKPNKQAQFNVDIDKTWLTDGGSVAFPAIQFALFTNPKKIYLVGCDCSNGYFNSSNNQKIKVNTEYKVVWEKLKEFADLYYPETEIISVNPVGLRGLFTDLDQE